MTQHDLLERLAHEHLSSLGEEYSITDVWAYNPYTFCVSFDYSGEAYTHYVSSSPYVLDMTTEADQAYDFNDRSGEYYHETVIGQLRSMVNWALENGFHECGYDPVEAVDKEIRRLYSIAKDKDHLTDYKMHALKAVTECSEELDEDDEFKKQVILSSEDDIVYNDAAGWVFWPWREDDPKGYWTAAALRVIADELDRRDEELFADAE